VNPAILLLIVFQTYWFQQRPANPPGTVPGTYPPVSQKNWAVTPPPGDDGDEKRADPPRTAAKDAVEKPGGLKNEEADDNADWDLIHASGIIQTAPRTSAKTHVVTKGENLWDLAEKYFGDPWFWPELWSWNGHITNPHWLFPGTVVNLTSKPEAVAEESTDTGPEEIFHGLEFQKTTVTVRNRAFIDDKTLKESRTIVGSPEEKSLLTVGDFVYIKDPEKKLKPGSVYTVFRPIQKVTDPQSKQVLGQLVQVLGEVKIKEQRPEGMLRAEITHSISVINRKDLVGTIQTKFKQVQPVVQKTEKPIVARIVATIEDSELLSANDMVVVNLGKDHQLKLGAVLPLIVRGDGLHAHLHPLDPSRKQDKSFPYETKGSLVVYEVHDKYCFAVILRSSHPINVGDEVLFGDVPDAPEKPAAQEKP